MKRGRFKIKGIYVAIAMVIIIPTSMVIFGISKAFSTPNTSNESKQEVPHNDVLADLNNADVIKVSKSIFSLNKKYELSVDNKNIGSLEGKYLTGFTGDKFTLLNNKDKVFGYEQQNKRYGIKWTRGADIFDSNGEVIGFFGEEGFDGKSLFNRKMHIYDKNEQEIGILKMSKFNIYPKFSIYDNEGNEDYFVSGFKWGMDIEVLDKESVIPVEQAVYLTAIMESIVSAENDD